MRCKSSRLCIVRCILPHFIVCYFHRMVSYNRWVLITCAIRNVGFRLSIIGYDLILRPWARPVILPIGVCSFSRFFCHFSVSSHSFILQGKFCILFFCIARQSPIRRLPPVPIVLVQVCTDCFNCLGTFTIYFSTIDFRILAVGRWREWRRVLFANQ